MTDQPFELKPISVEAIPRALEKAEQYRLLNNPRPAESICRDVLRVDPENQLAIVRLLLSLTDQFGNGFRVGVHHAEELLEKIEDGYERAYYAGMIYERWAVAQINAESAPGNVIYEWLCKAMHAYERAETHRPPGNDDAILRWNACARIIRRNTHLRPRPEDTTPGVFGDEVPQRP